MKEVVKKLLREVIRGLDVGDVDPEITVPENPLHGDYSTNVALRLSKMLKKPPMEIALWVKQTISEKQKAISLKGQTQNTAKDNQSVSRESSGKDVLQDIEKVEVVAPGFINLYLNDKILITQLQQVLSKPQHVGTSKTHVGKTVMVEFAHPNTHKAFHIGHLRNITTGESIVRLLESTGYKVIRANYQGDVGMHIAKCLYGIL